MPSTDVESPPPSAERSSLEYDRSSTHITRRQFRIFLWLLVINTLIFATWVFLPGGSQIIRSGWESYQNKRETRRRNDQQAALVHRAGEFTAPADEIVYEESPTEALKLINSPIGYVAIDTAPNRFDSQNRPIPQRPVFRAEPPIVTELRAHFFHRNGPPGKHGTVLLHALRKKNGEERLVWIIIDGDISFGDLPDRDDAIHSSLENSRHLTAYLIEQEIDNLAWPTMDINNRPTILRPRIDEHSAFTISRSETPGGPLKLSFDSKGCFRFYAAQLDSKDPSHFTIEYAIDGQRNTIDGYLKDDNSIIFSPRAGRIVSDGPSGKIWNPFARP